MSQPEEAPGPAPEPAEPPPAPAMDAAAWVAALRGAVDGEGGTLANGWHVAVKRRATGPQRDLVITSTNGHKYRSVVQAVAALTGAANGAGSSPGAKRPARKRVRKAAGPEPADGPAKRRRKQAAAASAGEGGAAAGGGHPVFGRLLAKARLLVTRIRRELDVLEAYEAEGSKGRLVVAGETQRAERQAERGRQELRELLRRCEAGEGQAIPAEAYDADGDLDQSHIMCALCSNGESTDDNDIVLCDGPCRRAYHERCCVPPFRLAELPEDADWLCPACRAKDEILDLVNETLETEYELDAPAEAVLAGGAGRPGAAQAGAAAEGGTWAALLGEDLASTDGEDESFRGASGSDGAAPTGAADRGSGSSSDSSSASESGSSDSEDSAEVVEGGRRRAPVDYVALAAAMFGGDSESEHGSDSDGNWT